MTEIICDCVYVNMNVENYVGNLDGEFHLGCDFFS
jgi:hypothetical protein